MILYVYIYYFLECGIVFAFKYPCKTSIIDHKSFSLLFFSCRISQERVIEHGYIDPLLLTLAESNDDEYRSAQTDSLRAIQTCLWNQNMRNDLKIQGGVDMIFAAVRDTTKKLVMIENYMRKQKGGKSEHQQKGPSTKTDTESVWMDTRRENKDSENEEQHTSRQDLISLVNAPWKKNGSEGHGDHKEKDVTIHIEANKGDEMVNRSNESTETMNTTTWSSSANLAYCSMNDSRNRMTEVAFPGPVDMDLAKRNDWLAYQRTACEMFLVQSMTVVGIIGEGDVHMQQEIREVGGLESTIDVRDRATYNQN